jgi:hypothetical protein
MANKCERPTSSIKQPSILGYRTPCVAAGSASHSGIEHLAHFESGHPLRRGAGRELHSVTLHFLGGRRKRP